jgi:hypothetical protein
MLSAGGGPPRRATPALPMFKWFLISIVLVPVLAGLVAARTRGRAGLVGLLAGLVLYDIFYIVLMYYLRVRWVG